MNKLTLKRNYFGGLDGEAVDTGIFVMRLCRLPIDGRCGVVGWLKTALRNFTFVVLTVACGMVMLAGNAQAEISGLETYSLVCQKALTILDRDVNSFQNEFGKPLSKRTRKYKLFDDPKEDYAVATTVSYPNSVTLFYTTFNKTITIDKIVFASIKSVKLIGFDENTASEIINKYGAPSQETSTSLKYGCDSVELIFTTKDGRNTAMQIISPLI